MVSKFVEWIKNKKFVHDYETGLISKIPLIFGKDQKHTYDSKIMHTFILSKIDLINSDKYCNRLVRLFLHYLDDKELISNEQLILIKKKIINIKGGVDNHVPIDNEVIQTLSQLSDDVKVVYLVYLISGIRKIEGKYLIDKLDVLKCQQFDGFVKITMNYLRNTKNSYFCYLPTTIYKQLIVNKQLSVGSLESEIKRKKLIPIKYCRKWFYTKCIELGVPESIADYYQGRSAKGVGSNHYLGRQMLADKNYNKIVSYLINLM